MALPSLPPAPFGARLRAALDTRDPLCVGIDPHAALLRSWEVSDDVAGLERFARSVAEALAEQVAVLKPQVAFFERFGSRGIAVLERVLGDIRAAGALALLDAKRGDIGSTVEAYAAAYFDRASPLYADALTASPYLGPGSLQPLADAATRSGSGLFTLALTSNPEGRAVQEALTGTGATVAGAVLGAAAKANAGAVPLGSYGVVIGATVHKLPADVVEQLGRLNGPVLAPGLGAQGATARDLARLFGAGSSGAGSSGAESSGAGPSGAGPVTVLPSYSRDVLAAGPSRSGLREAARSAAEQCRAALKTQ